MNIFPTIFITYYTHGLSGSLRKRRWKGWPGLFSRDWRQCMRRALHTPVGYEWDFQILLNLRWLYWCWIIDIKSDNIVVDFDQYGILSRIKLIDLGDSVKVEPTTHHPFTHPTYRAPEGLLGLPWTTKVDLWALGTLVCGNCDHRYKQDKPANLVQR